jgi:hypothetical protein
MADVVAKLAETNTVLVQMASEKDKEINQLRIQLGKQPTPIAAAASTFVRHGVKAKYAAYTKKIDARGVKIRMLETENAAHKLRAKVTEHENESLAVKIAELETKNLSQSKLIDEKDAEARENENAMHDMYARQKLDREDIEEKELMIEGSKIIAEHEQEGVKATYAAYAKRIKTLGGKVKSLENLIEMERDVKDFFVRENDEWYSDNNVLRARVTELESKLEQQADSIEDIKTQIIDEKDAEARVIMDTLHDMEARHQLDSEDIEDKYDRLYSCSIIGKVDQENIGKLQKELEETKKDNAKLEFENAGLTATNEEQQDRISNIKNRLKARHGISFLRTVLNPNSSNQFVFSYTGDLIDIESFKHVFCTLKSYKQCPVREVVDAAKGAMHYCRISFSHTNKSTHYYEVLKYYREYMKSKVPGWRGMTYGSISLPEYTPEWDANVVRIMLATLPTMNAVGPDFNWV